MGRTLVRFEGFGFRYAGSERSALEDINLEISAGEYITLLGACGAGKTTFCTAINGIVPNMLMGTMVGRVVVDGNDTREMPVREMARKVGMVFDNPEFQLTQMSVREEVALGLENLGVPRGEMLARIEEALRIVGLVGFDGRSPMRLSGGQQQRVAIASALAMRPEILVLDEPTSNLDPVGKKEVYDIASTLNKHYGMTIVLADQEVEEMAVFASRILVLSSGKVILDGTPKQVFGQVQVLDRLGLATPQVTQVFHKLGGARFKADGSPGYPTTLNEAHAALAQALER
jgi:energy-coupling factor transporter ATP-binding protein EcfA2